MPTNKKKSTGKRKPSNKRPTLTGNAVHPRGNSLSPGNLVLMRTAVHSWAGRVVRTLEIEGVAFVELESASWIADTGRYHEAFFPGGVQCASNSEIEPVPGVVAIQIGSIGDIAILASLPTGVR